MERLIYISLGLIFGSNLWAQQLKTTIGESTFHTQILATDLEVPWDLVWGPDDALWFTEKKGTINRLDLPTNIIHTLGTIPDVFVSPVENSGLHSMVFHPSWPDSNFLIVHYTHGEFASKIARLTVDLKTYTISDNQILLPELKGNRSHNGSRLTVDSTGNLLISLGDAYLFEIAQDLNALNGKVLRFTPWGAVPKDNPFPGSYIWSMGHRNPQGLVYGTNHKLYSSEHGPTTDDELNLIEKGRNYGWPGVNGYCDLPSEKRFGMAENYRDPIWTWTPTTAPSGLEFVAESQFPELDHSLLQCFLKGRGLAALTLSPSGDSILDQQVYFEGDFLRLRDVVVADDGRLFFSTSNIEKTKPGSLPGDDKIVQVSNPERTGESQVFQQFEDQGKALRVQIKNIKRAAHLQFTTSYGKALMSWDLKPGEALEIQIPKETAGHFWLKLHAGANTSYFRRIEFTANP